MDPGSRKIAELLHTERPQNQLETYASTFAVSFVQSLYEEPSFAVKQALAHMRPGRSGEKLAAQVEQSRPKEIETETLSTNWLAKVTGSALGQLPLLLLTHRASGALLGKAERMAAIDLEKSLGKTSRDLINTGMTGFAYGSVFTPTSNAALANGDFWTNRGLHGLSNGIAFSAMHFSMNKLTAKSLDGSNLNPTLWQKPLVAGGLAGIPSGFFATETNSLIDNKRLARNDELVDGIATQCVLGSGFAKAEAKLRQCPESSMKGTPRDFSDFQNQRKTEQHELLSLQEKIKLLQRENEQLSQISAIDALTGLKNQRAGTEILDTEFARSSRALTPLSVLFLDLNGFKKVNDGLGHDVGNNALVKSADLISERLRKSDSLFRNGGDEFVGILPDTSYEGALRVAKDIQSHLSFELSASDGTKYPIGTSIGVATFDPLTQNFSDAKSLLREADQKMYIDKRRIKGTASSADASSVIESEEKATEKNNNRETASKKNHLAAENKKAADVVRVSEVFVDNAGELITPNQVSKLNLESKTSEQLAKEGISRKHVGELNPSEIVNPIERNAAAEEKVRQLHNLSAENQILVDDFKKFIDAKYESYSYGEPKQTQSMLKKVGRPDIRERKPWFNIEHIRDSQRFTTILDNLNDLPRIARDLKKSPFQIIEANLSKMEPNGRGWRAMPFDLRAPNGQLLEYQIIPREMYEAGRQTHPIYDKWRDRPVETLSLDEKLERRDALVHARDISQRAWADYLKRTGQSDQHVQQLTRELRRVLMEKA